MAEKAEVKTLEALIAEREKEGVKVAQKVTEFLSVMGLLRPDGDVQLEEDAVRFEWNRVLNTVNISHGATDVLRVNLSTKVCPLFKNGSWQLVYGRILNRFETADKGTLAKKNEVRVRENLSLPKI